jgi:glyoxylase-like metal-dependent hydrolase (beta-lactamase superfamily II)
VADEAWREVGDRVFVRRHELFDLNIGLVVGDTACALVDTGLSHRQGRELAAAVRRVTPLPWLAVNTHAHFDHCFGNAVLAPAEIWGHERCVDVLTAYGEIQRDAFRADAAARGRHDLAAELAEVVVVPPDRTLADEARLELGGRAVHLRHLGRGHTDNDVVVDVPDAAVLFAGDLVEEGAPPSFEDAFPLDWPATLERLVPLARGAVVPGHGAVVDRGFVLAQASVLAGAARLAREAYAAGRGAEEAAAGAAAELRLPAHTVRHAVDRAYRQLRGEPPYDPPERVRAALGLG